MKRTVIGIVAAFLLASIIVPATVTAFEGASVVVREPSLLVPSQPVVQPVTSGDRASYSGTIRLYVVEPVSRWKDNNNHTYEFGTLAIPLVTGISVADGATWETELIWNSIAEGGIGSISESNIMVQAAIFNSTPHQEFSDPPSGSPFWAYDVDACAQATPNFPGENVTAPGFTHQVFIEEGTTTW